ncbi:MAG TPA: LPXTG cell wall anchor domain-containing protein [Gemmatimonadaceae bacterium]|nr:LPXTG cell wall anchor domain-containing protein [Gemmatimonadaceae bacterium]
MRIFGSLLMAIGTFLILAAVLSLAGPELQRGGVNVSGSVSSFEWTLLVGVVLLGAGALLRRRGRRDSGVVPPAA